MAEILTPLLDAQLINADPRRLNRWTDAKESLSNAIDKGIIFNAELTEAKYELSRGVESALRPLAQAWYTYYRSLSSTDQLEFRDADISQYCNLNGAPALIKRNRNFLHCPEVANYVAALQEIVLLNNAVQLVKPLAVKGRRPAAKPQVEDLSNTAICSICNRRQKLTAAGKLVHHGFVISAGGTYLGFRSGSCFGVGYLPAEVSTEGNVAFDAYLYNEYLRSTEHLRKLTAGEITVLSRTKEVLQGRRFVPVIETFAVGSPEFPELLERAIEKENSRLSAIKYDRDWNQKKIDTWVAKPLYADPLK